MAATDTPDPDEAGTGRPLDDLAAALRRRLEVIGDHALRSQDPDRHLRALQEAGERIAAAADAARQAGIPPRLSHFLERGSYEKALAWLETGPSQPHPHAGD